MDYLWNFVKDPELITTVCIIYIIGYYLVSFLSISAVDKTNSVWKRNSILDVLTSITWFGFAIVLIWSLATLAFSTALTLNYLIVYYFLFIFLFAFCYSILGWHWDMLEGVNRDNWKSLVDHLLISVQTQTTIGYTRGKPKHLLAEVLSCVQALLGIFLITISIAKAVNQLR
jgi:hypothetical protein